MCLKRSGATVERDGSGDGEMIVIILLQYFMVNAFIWLVFNLMFCCCCCRCRCVCVSFSFFFSAVVDVFARYDICHNVHSIMFLRVAMYVVSDETIVFFY